VERRVVGEGVEVIVLRVPEWVVRKVVGEIVEVRVVRMPEEVVTKVRVIRSVLVGVMTLVLVVRVPPAVVVKEVIGGVVIIVVGVPLMVVTKEVGEGVIVMTVGVPPTLEVMETVMGWKETPPGVDTTTWVTGVPAMSVTTVKVMGWPGATAVMTAPTVERVPPA